MNVSNQLVAAPVNGQEQQAQQQPVPQQIAPPVQQQKAQEQKEQQQKAQQQKAQHQRAQQQQAQQQQAQQQKAQQQNAQRLKAQQQKPQQQKAKTSPKQAEQSRKAPRSSQAPVRPDNAGSKEVPQKKSKLHCPVPGCETATPHASDPVVKQLIHEFPSPERMIHWALRAMTELRDSMCDDLTTKRAFAWHFRMRQPMELYVRTLYAVLLADEKELHHVLSGALPNSLPFLYKRVNKTILQNRGRLLSEQGGHGGRTFTPIDHCNESAHVSFRSLWLCIDAKRKPQGIPTPEEHRATLEAYCKSLADMHKLFKAKKTKNEVLAHVIELHQLTPLFAS